MAPLDVDVAVTHGRIAPSVIERARSKIASVAHVAPAPVLHARVTLSSEPAPHRERPAVVKAVLDVNGRPVRVHVAAATLDAAIDEAEARLRQQLETLAERREARRHPPSAVFADSWRHGTPPTSRPEWFPRPVADRRLVRRKSTALTRGSVAAAAEDLALLDLEWLLFVEASSGADAVLERTDAGYRLRLPATAPSSPSVVIDVADPVEIRRDAPSMTFDAAVHLLDALDDRFLFFVDTATGRGRVVYHRYDGHYGTITNADDGGSPEPGDRPDARHS